MAGRRRFGWIRKLPSGRWQASYLDREAIRRTAPSTFRTKRDAELWLNRTEVELLRGEWVNPQDQRITLSEFGSRWIRERPGLRPRTLDLYRSLFTNHIAEHLGRVALGDLDPGRIRKWRAELLASGTSATVTAKSYRLLRAILTTAVDDGTLPRNPCRIRGAGSDPTQERPVLSVPQVFELARRMPTPTHRLLVLVTTFASLRWGEATALRRTDLDTDSGTVWVRSAFGRPYSGPVQRGPVKSRAGVRLITLPRPIADLLTEHLAERVGPDDDALVFPGDKGGPMSRPNFNTRVGWAEHVAAIGVPGLRFHDLRHTGNTLAAMTGASLRDLMTRMGHDSMRAALIYQHNTQGADRKISDALEALIGEVEADGQADDQADQDEDDDGASGAMVPAR